MKTDLFFYTTEEDQRYYFSGEIGPTMYGIGSAVADIEPGIYRIVDTQLYRIEPGLPHCLQEQRC